MRGHHKGVDGWMDGWRGVEWTEGRGVEVVWAERGRRARGRQPSIAAQQLSRERLLPSCAARSRLITTCLSVSAAADPPLRSHHEHGTLQIAHLTSHKPIQTTPRHPSSQHLLTVHPTGLLPLLLLLPTSSLPMQQVAPMTASPPPLSSPSPPLSALPPLSPCSSIDLAVLSSLDSLRLHLSSFRTSVSSHLHQQQSLQQQQHNHTLHLIQQLREDQQHSLDAHHSELQAQWKRWKTQHHPRHPALPHPHYPNLNPPPPTPSPSQSPSPSPLTSAELTSLIQAEVRAAVTAATTDALTTIDALRQRVHHLEQTLAGLPPPQLPHLRQSSLSSPAAALAPRSLSPSSPSPSPCPPGTYPPPPPSTSPLSQPRSSLKKSVRFNEDLHARLFLTIDPDDHSTSDDPPPPPESDDDEEFAVPSPAHAVLDGGGGGGGGEGVGRGGVGVGVGGVGSGGEGGEKGEWEGLGGEVQQGGSGLRVEVMHSPCTSLDFQGITTSYEYGREGKEETEEMEEVEDDKAKEPEDIGLTDLSTLPADEADAVEAECQQEAQKVEERGDSDASAVLSDSSSSDEDDEAESPVAVRPPPPSMSALPSLSLLPSVRAKSSLAIRARPASTAPADPDALLSILHPVQATKQGRESDEIEEEIKEEELEQGEEDSDDDDVLLQVGGRDEHEWRVNGNVSLGARGGGDDSDDEAVVLVKG